MTLSQAPGLPTGAPQQFSAPSRQQRQRPQPADATSGDLSARRASLVAAAKAGANSRRPLKQQSSKPAQPVTGAQYNQDVHKLPRRRSLRLTKEKLDNPDGDSAAPGNRGLNVKRISPDGGSLGARAGRQFTVGNIGNNGLIYLRCVLLTVHHLNLFFSRHLTPLNCHISAKIECLCAILYIQTCRASW
jgi:hypothetical protein